MPIADTLYINGTIITMNDHLPEVEAVAVAGDRIIKVGTKNELLRVIDEKTDIVNLNGQTMLPGFYDSHSHFSMSGNIYAHTVLLNSPPMGSITAIDEALKALSKKASENQDMIIGFGFDDTLVQEKRNLTKTDLDSVSTEIPIIVYHASGHVAYVNSVMLNRANYTKDTPDPEGGRICRDPENGELTGVLEETAFMSLPIKGGFLNAESEDKLFEAIATANKHYAKVGVTTANEGGVHSADDIKSFYEAEKLKKLTLRITLCPFYPTQNEADQIAKNYESQSKLVRVQGTKILQDGSIQAYTAHLSEPYYTSYQGKNDWCAYSTTNQAHLTETILGLYKDGHQVVCHCNGDQALDEYLNAIEEAQKHYPRQDDRPIVVHAQTARYDQLKRMKKLNATPSFFSLHTYYWGDRHMDIFLGPNRGANISATKWAEEAGLIYSTHCDTPITPQTPLLSIWATVNRISSTGRPVGKHQAVSVWEALKSYTISAAYQYYDDHDKGSIESGKLADFVILNNNPLTCPKEDIKDIKVLQTIVGNHVVYDCDKDS